MNNRFHVILALGRDLGLGTGGKSVNGSVFCLGTFGQASGQRRGIPAYSANQESVVVPCRTRIETDTPAAFPFKRAVEEIAGVELTRPGSVELTSKTRPVVGSVTRAINPNWPIGLLTTQLWS